MTIADLASIGSFIGAVAVVVSLVYLSLQIRQNTKHSRAVIQQGRAARIADTALRIAEAPAWVDKCFEGAPDVSPQEVRRFLNIARAMFVSAEDSFFQHRDGLMTAIVFESFEVSVKATLSWAGLAAAWKLSREIYEPEFRSYMDRALSECRPRGQLTGRSEQWSSAVAEFRGLEAPGHQPKGT
jgi:hypothetical protein